MPRFALTSTEIHSRLKGKECRGNTGEQRVRIEARDAFLYPDGLIKCPPFEYHEKDPNGLTNPRVIFEVLSKATELYDRTGKFELYQLITECMDYVLIDYRRVHVEHYSREPGQRWTLAAYNWRKDVLNLVKYDVSIPLGDLYDGLELVEGMILVGGDDN